MENDETEAEGTTRGNEWEVVSLTASIYDAAPGPRRIESTDDVTNLPRTEEESSRALLMSNHFVSPMSQHDNPTVEPDMSKTCSELGVESADFTKKHGLDSEKGDGLDNFSNENQKIKELSDVEDQNVIQFLDEKSTSLSIANMNFEEGKDLQGLDLVEEHHLYGAAKSSSFHAEADISGSTSVDGSKINPEESDPSHKNLDAPLDSLKSQDTVKENRHDVPCEAWWKRQAASLYSQAKEANKFWSVVVAAALMGLVILGHRWRQERWQLQQHKWQFAVNNENKNGTVGPISRFKDALVMGKQQSLDIHGNS